ncbi:MAG: hypothetical protein WCF84_18315 [Anaerolineae bacterium]
MKKATSPPRARSPRQRATRADPNRSTSPLEKEWGATTERTQEVRFLVQLPLVTTGETRAQ